MSSLTKVMVSPHIHSGRSTSGIMRDVIIALLPATVAGIVIFGWRALLPVFVCVACCVGFEALFNLITKKDQTIGDLSAAVTGFNNSRMAVCYRFIICNHCCKMSVRRYR